MIFFYFALLYIYIYIYIYIYMSWKCNNKQTLYFLCLHYLIYCDTYTMQPPFMNLLHPIHFNWKYISYATRTACGLFYIHQQWRLYKADYSNRRKIFRKETRCFHLCIDVWVVWVWCVCVSECASMYYYFHMINIGKCEEKRFSHVHAARCHIWWVNHISHPFTQGYFFEKLHYFRGLQLYNNFQILLHKIKVNCLKTRTKEQFITRYFLCAI